MGKQSSRLYFKGKDHKDIYFQGHYHDAMYLTDGGGNATLVWEKIKGILDTKTFCLAYKDGLYIALIANGSVKDITIYGGTDIYGMNPNSIKDIQAGYKRVHSLFIFENKLEIVYERSYYINSYTIQITGGKLDTGNAILDDLDGYYWYSSRVLVGKKCKKYMAAVFSSSVSIASKPGILIDSKAVSYEEFLENEVSRGVFFISGKLFVDSTIAGKGMNIDAPIRFFELNDFETELALREIKLPPSLVNEFKAEAEKAFYEKIPTGYSPKDWSYSFSVYQSSNHAGGVCVLDNNKGAVFLNLSATCSMEAAQGHIPTSSEFGYGNAIYRAIVDFSTCRITKYEKTEMVALNEAQGFSRNWRVQFAFRITGGKEANYLSYGKISDTNDSYIPFSEIEKTTEDEIGLDDYSGGEIVCIAEIGGFLYVGTMRSGDFINKFYIRIDTRQNKAEFIEHYIGIKK